VELGYVASGDKDEAFLKGGLHHITQSTDVHIHDSAQRFEIRERESTEGFVLDLGASSKVRATQEFNEFFSLWM